MSPLALAVYRQLYRRIDRGPRSAPAPRGPRRSSARAQRIAPRGAARARAWPVVTYRELADAIGRAAPALATHPRSARLHAALGEVTRACQASRLPCLTALVVRADSRRPSGGYYATAHPRARSDRGRIAAWERELVRVIAALHCFPEVLS
jgi:hypothetical protein